MKLIYRADTLEGAKKIKVLLENAGIPVSISNKGFAQLRLFFTPNTLGVFIYNAKQCSDAMVLLKNKKSSC